MRDNLELKKNRRAGWARDFRAAYFINMECEFRN